MSENEATLLGLDYITVITDAAQLQSDVETGLTINIVDADDVKTPGSQIDGDYDSTLVNITATDKDGNSLVVKQGGTPNSQATVENGIKVISDFSVTIPNGPADSPVTIKVETALTEDAIKTTTGRDYKPFGQVEKVVTAVTSVFQVTAPGVVTRGVAFNLVIQSMLSGSPETGFVPTTAVTISLDSPDDGSDIISPTTTDNTGWVNGQKTVSVTISGGSGSDTTNVKADDDSSARTGLTDIQVEDATPTEIDHVDTQVYSSFVIEGAPSALNWNNLQNLAQTTFEADTTLNFNPDGNAHEFLRWVSRTSTDSLRARLKCGRIKFTLSNPADKTGVIAADLKIRLHSVQQADFGGPFIYSPDALTRELRLKTSEDAALFTSGLALSLMTPDRTYQFTEINQKSIDAGAATPAGFDATVEILLDIPAAVITGMTGDDLYVWFYIHRTSNVPFVPPWSSIGDGKNPIEAEIVDRVNHPSTTKLVLYK